MLFIESPFSKLAKKRIAEIENEVFSDFNKPLWKSFKYSYSSASKIEETEAAYLVHISVPGHTSKSVEVDINAEAKTFTVEAKSENGSNPTMAGDISHEYELPSDVDVEGADATVKDGILTISFQKVKNSAKNYKVKVR